MLRKKINIWFLGVAFVAQQAMADNHGTKVGATYDLRLGIDDGEVMKAEGGEADSTTELMVNMASLEIDAKPAKEVDFSASFNLVEPGLDLVSVYYNLDMFSVGLGREKVNVGGWNFKDNYGEVGGTGTAFMHGYSSKAPWGYSEELIALKAKVAGTITLQILNDVINDVSCEPVATIDDEGEPAVSTVCDTTSQVFKNDVRKDMGLTFEYIGDFEGWMPLLQVAMYDRMKSNAFSVGIKGNAAGVGLAASYTLDSRKNAETDETDAHTAIDVSANYDAGDWLPYVDFHTYDNKQGGTDAKGNTTLGSIDDNAQQIGLGVKCKAMGQGYVPYLAFNIVSQKVVEEAKENSKSGLVINTGVHGEF